MRKNSKGLILMGVLLAMFLASLDQTIVATAMPQIVRELNGLTQLSWVVTAYMLASTVTIPIYGKLSDIFGRRGLYILGIVVFLAGSMLSGISQNMTQLILFRGLQGIGAGAIMVSSIAVIGDIFPPAERSRWQGVLFGVFGLSSIAGPLLGGWLTDSFSWRWVFYVNLPLGVLTIAVLMANIPQMARKSTSPSIDFAGAILITMGLVPLMLALVWGGSHYSWSSWQIMALMVAAVFSLLAFALVERKAAAPILSLSLFKNRVFTVSALILFLTSMGMFGAILYIPVFAQGVIGVSATNSGLIMTPMMMGMVFASIISGQVVSRTGKYKILIIIGMLIAVLGMFLFTQIGPNTSSMALSMRMVLVGIGLGSTGPILTIAVQSAVGQEKLGEVTAGSQLFRSIGGTVGTAVLGGIMNSQLSTRLANVADEPFVVAVRQLDPAADFSKVNINSLQRVLSTDGQAQIRAMIAKTPDGLQSQLSASFAHFQETIKVAFSSAVDHVFLVSSILLLGAVILVFFLPEIPIRKSNQRPPSESH